MVYTNAILSTVGHWERMMAKKMRGHVAGGLTGNMGQCGTCSPVTHAAGGHGIFVAGGHGKCVTHLGFSPHVRVAVKSEEVDQDECS